MDIRWVPVLGCLLFLLLETMLQWTSMYTYSGTYTFISGMDTLLHIYSYGKFLEVEVVSQKLLTYKMLKDNDKLSSKKVVPINFHSQYVYVCVSMCFVHTKSFDDYLLHVGSM